MSRYRSIRYRQIVLDQLIDQLDDAVAMIADGGAICCFLQHRNGILHGHGIFGVCQHGMIVFSVSDRSNVMRGQFQLLERCGQPGGLIDAMG